MANVERVKEIRNLLASIPDKQYAHDIWSDKDEECGTVCCLAGWTLIGTSFGREAGYQQSETGRIEKAGAYVCDHEVDAAELLDFNREQMSLFFSQAYPGFDLFSVTREMVIEKLDELIASETPA